ncbi:hypothetical protein QM298_13670 [Pseudomonas mendocina]|nr:MULTISPECIES: hypothetical protein [Pseudomonas]MDM9653275.1 hypothetical protein [Pseudomonas wenzhouensis]MDV5861931.1 hypothetical protein [Pseudomonas mendocina]WGL62882.1 hypothetical protein QDX81_18335 [Pseudomonas sp. CW003PS]
MNRQVVTLSAVALGFGLLLTLAWWGWRQGGLALLQLGVGIC